MSEAQGRRPFPWRGIGIATVVGGILLVGSRLAGLLPEFSNPFTTETIVREQPPLLLSLQDISEYQAATGNYQVVVDLEEDAAWMPDFLRGERTLFVAAGTVDAEVTFASLSADAVTISTDQSTVWIRLPHAHLSPARIDPENSYVVSRERGLLDRLGAIFSDNPTSEQQLYLLAEAQLEQAAATGELLVRAEENTEQMLQTMLRSLGFQRITVTFGEPGTADQPTEEPTEQPTDEPAA